MEMKLEQMGIEEVRGISHIQPTELLLMILKRLERIENKIDQKVDGAIKERLELKK